MILSRLGAIILILAPIWGHSQTYCLPIEKARLLIEDALKKRIQDSVITANTVQIEDLTADRDGIRRDCKTLVDSLLANAMDFRGIIDIKDLQNVALQKEVAKEKKRGKIFKWLFYAAAAGLIFESVKD